MRPIRDGSTIYVPVPAIGPRDELIDGYAPLTPELSNYDEWVEWIEHHPEDVEDVTGR